MGRVGCKSLPAKHEALGLFPVPQKQGVVVHGCNLKK